MAKKKLLRRQKGFDDDSYHEIFLKLTTPTYHTHRHNRGVCELWGPKKMRFAHHLSSHLTPEWRNHYIDYDDLKRRIYKIVGTAPPKTQEEEDNCKLSNP